jgi:hypothetical protein
MLTLVASCIVGYCIMQLFPTEGLLPFIETTVIMVISTSLIIATCGMNRDERHFMKDRILLFLKR